MNENNSLVCVIDDDSSTRESLRNLLRSAGLKVQTFGSAQEFLTSRPSETPSCLVLDVQLPGISGLDLQRKLTSTGAELPIIFMTGYGNIPMSVRAMKAGAFEFFTKPFRDADLLSAVHQAIERGRQIEQLNNKPAQQQSRPDEKPRREIRFSEMVGKSAALRQVLEQVEMVAPSSATVLILGETGTGKELIARAIHQRSWRSDKPLVRVNCTSIPKDLFESEFFGHVRGAFTGAIRDRVGRFEIAAGGTLFLDEVGEIPLELQSKLLRVLQEKSFERVGEEKTRHTDVRIIAATNRDLEAEIAAGRFREDLYYRLSVFPLKVAALRERKEDIPLLTTYFIEVSVKELRCPKPRLTQAGIETLIAYHWPGNVRELRNVIGRAVIFARGGPLQFNLSETVSSIEPTSRGLQDEGLQEPEYITELDMRRRERENLCAVLKKARGKIKGVGGAAELLGIKPTTLISRLEKLGLKRPCWQERFSEPSR
jgi:DNA-binding NtrC family response regulator